MTDIALSSFTALLSPSLSSTSPLTSRLKFELVRLVSLQLEVARSLLVSPLLRLIMLALSLAHSDSTCWLLLTAASLINLD